MATITTDLICNLNQPVAATFLHGNLFSQDNAGNTINVHVMDNGEPATIGGTVSANVIRADGNTVAVSGSMSGNQCSVVLPQACYAVPGRVEIIIKLTQSTTITTIAAIVANVYRSTTDTVVDPGTIIPSIQALIEEIEDAVDSIPVDYSGLLATIAADYSSSKTYQVGQYAWQGGVLKRCIVPITTAETYTAAHWTNAVISDDLSALKSALRHNENVINGIYTGKLVISTSDIIQGSYNRYGEFVPNPSVIRTAGFIPVYMGQVLKYTPSTNDLRMSLGKFGINKDWIGESTYTTDRNIYIDFNGYIIAAFFNSTYTNITPQDYDSTFIINNDIVSSVMYEASFDDLVQGSYNGQGTITINSNSIRSRGFLKVQKGDVLYFNPSGDNIGRMLIGYFSTSYAYKSDSSWYTDKTVLVMDSDGYLILLFKNKSQTEVTPDKYDAETYIIRTIDEEFDIYKSDVQKKLSQGFSNKNLIGLDPNVFYPVYIPSGTTLTMSTADGLPLGAYNVNLSFYDANKQDISSGGWNFNPAQVARTITVNNGGNTAYYVKWSNSPGKNVQLETGKEATSYVPYSIDIHNTELIRKIYSDVASELQIIDNTFISDYSDKSVSDYADAYNEEVLNSGGNTEQFLFYTDPHLAYQTGNVPGMLPRTKTDINFIEKVYNALPFSFLLCGGDWLGNRDVPLTAVNKLTYIDGFMRKKFHYYYPMIGNHDTNEQGVSEEGAELGTGVLNVSTLKNAYQMFRNEQKTYYSVDAPNSKLYVFDTGRTGQAIDAYQTTQIKWFANALKTDNSPHIILSLHIFYVNTISSGIIQPITTELLKVAQAYNARSSITFDDAVYDYSSATGKVSFLIGGHTHRDVSGTLYDIPFVLSMDGTAQGAEEAGYSTERLCTFDMCLADWDTNTLTLKRVGYGIDRTLAIL